jgi:hypothetical protein
MASRKLGLFVAAAVVSAAALMPPCAVAQLRTDYYASACPNLENIVRGSVRQSMAQSQISAPAALRLFFHDCAVTVRTHCRVPSSSSDELMINRAPGGAGAAACRAATRRS